MPGGCSTPIAVGHALRGTCIGNERTGLDLFSLEFIM